jgi:serpin B
MPHFSIQNVYQLKNALSGMGMAKAFSRRADFSGMCMVPCALSEVRHKTYLAVNERGTVAAAATSVGISESATSPNKFDMIIDHPFFVSIQDSVTGAVLFTGLVANPAE